MCSQFSQSLRILNRNRVYGLFNMATSLVRIGGKQVRPVLSVDKNEARRRVLNLYREWNRQILPIIKVHNLPITVKQGKEKVKEMFMRNKDVTDIRVIDHLVIKGHMELDESINVWKQSCHVMAYFKTTVEPKPQDFLSRFFAGIE